MQNYCWEVFFLVDIPAHRSRNRMPIGMFGLKQVETSNERFWKHWVIFLGWTSRDIWRSFLETFNYLFDLNKQIHLKDVSGNIELFVWPEQAETSYGHFWKHWVICLASASRGTLRSFLETLSYLFGLNKQRHLMDISGDLYLFVWPEQAETSYGNFWIHLIICLAKLGAGNLPVYTCGQRTWLKRLE